MTPIEIKRSLALRFSGSFLRILAIGVSMLLIGGALGYHLKYPLYESLRWALLVALVGAMTASAVNSRTNKEVQCSSAC